MLLNWIYTRVLERQTLENALGDRLDHKHDDFPVTRQISNVFALLNRVVDARPNYLWLCEK